MLGDISTNSGVRFMVVKNLKPLIETKPLIRMKQLIASHKKPLIDDKLNIALKLEFKQEVNILRVMSILSDDNIVPKGVLGENKSYKDWHKITHDGLPISNTEFREFSLSKTDSLTLSHDSDLTLRFSPREMDIIVMSDFIDTFGCYRFNTIEISMIEIILEKETPNDQSKKEMK